MTYALPLNVEAIRESLLHLGCVFNISVSPASVDLAGVEPATSSLQEKRSPIGTTDPDLVDDKLR